MGREVWTGGAACHGRGAGEGGATAEEAFHRWPAVCIRNRGAGTSSQGTPAQVSIQGQGGGRTPTPFRSGRAGLSAVEMVTRDVSRKHTPSELTESIFRERAYGAMYSPNDLAGRQITGTLFFTFPLAPVQEGVNISGPIVLAPTSCKIILGKIQTIAVSI